MNDYENGELKFLNFCTLHTIFKINRLKNLFQNPQLYMEYHTLPYLVKTGWVNFFLTCIYNIVKILIKMSIVTAITISLPGLSVTISYVQK